MGFSRHISCCVYLHQTLINNSHLQQNQTPRYRLWSARPCLRKRPVCSGSENIPRPCPSGLRGGSQRLVPMTTLTTPQAARPGKYTRYTLLESATLFSETRKVPPDLEPSHWFYSQSDCDLFTTVVKFKYKQCMKASIDLYNRNPAHSGETCDL